VLSLKPRRIYRQSEQLHDNLYNINNAITENICFILMLISDKAVSPGVFSNCFETVQGNYFLSLYYIFTVYS